MRQKLLLLLLTLCALTAQAQEVRTIRGRVTDGATSEPLPGATVFIDPALKQAPDYNPQGVTTDYDGNFLFTLPKTVTKLIISFIGFDSQTLILSDKEYYEISLKENVGYLSEVIVTGYQQIEKRKLTSSIGTVQAEDLMQAGVPSVDQLLLGQIPGLIVTPLSGGPGAKSQIRIRGTSTLSAYAEPLWVLDGIPLDGDQIPADITSQESLDLLSNTSIAGLNPGDIESITVLKDAAATSIYGARAANGVIVITTKKGREGAPRINFSSNLFYTARPNPTRLNLLNASEKVDLELSLLRNPLHNYRAGYGDVARLINEAGLMEKFVKDGLTALPDDLQKQIQTLRNEGADWFAEIYEPTFNQQYGLSISGGTQRIRYYLSGGYFDEQGTTKGTSFRRYNLTSNTSIDLSDRFTVGLNLFANQSHKGSYLAASAVSNPQSYSRNVNPYRKIVDAKGDFVYDPDVVDGSGNVLPFNYREEQQNTRYDLENQSLKAFLEMEYKPPIDRLRLTTQLGVQVENNAIERWGDANSYYTRAYRHGSMYKKVPVLPEGGIIQNTNDRFLQYNWRNQGFYRFFLGEEEQHDFDLMLGMELRRNKQDNVHTKGFGYDHQSMTTKPVVFPEGFSSASSALYRQYMHGFAENAFTSFFSTASYTYDGRYTLFGSLRYDGSNLFGVDPKYRYLPLWSISGAWHAVRESFIRDLGWVSDLRLRASYGIQGNVDRNTSPFIKGVWDNKSFFPGTSEPIVTVLSPPNQNLRWEKTSTTNVGFDLGIRDRVNIAFDYYHRNSQDLITTKAIPQENGFDFVSLNWGSIVNHGWELVIRTVNLHTDRASWSTELNLARNISKVTDYNVRENSFTPSLEGYPVNAVFALPTAGLDEQGLMTFRGPDGQRLSYEEFYRLKAGPFGSVVTEKTPEEYRALYQYIGDRDPALTGGFNNTFKYRGFDLAIYSHFILGRMSYRQPPYHPTRVNPGVNYSRDILSAWSPELPSGTLPKLLSDAATPGNEALAYGWLDSYDPQGSYADYDIWYKKMSYWRIGSIRLGYTIDGKTLQSKVIKNIRLSLEARNPFVLSSDYHGYFDPETYGNIYAQPISRSYSFGLNVSF